EVRRRALDLGVELGLLLDQLGDVAALGLGILDLRLDAVAFGLQLVARREQRVASGEQILLRLDRRGIRRGVGLAFVLAATGEKTDRNAEEEQERPSTHTPRVYYSPPHAPVSRPPRAEPAPRPHLPGREAARLRPDRG